MQLQKMSVSKFSANQSIKNQKTSIVLMNQKENQSTMNDFMIDYK